MNIVQICPPLIKCEAQISHSFTDIPLIYRYPTHLQISHSKNWEETVYFILILSIEMKQRVSNKEQCARCFTMKTFVGRFAPNKVLVFVRLCTIFITKNREEYISFSFQSSQLKWNKEWVIKNIVQCVIQLYTHSLNA